MKYEILFNQQSNGVWARHETLEAAQRHINTLLGMVSGSFTWSISHEGKEIKTNKPTIKK